MSGTERVILNHSKRECFNLIRGATLEIFMASMPGELDACHSEELEVTFKSLLETNSNLADVASRTQLIS